MGKSGAQWCLTCSHRWIPCSAGCRGYQLEVDHKSHPKIRGCSGCGVPDQIAWLWPEAWRAMAHKLNGHKLEALVD